MTPEQEKRFVDDLMKPFVERYDSVGSGIDNVHYWWIYEYFSENIANALAIHRDQILEEERERILNELARVKTITYRFADIKSIVTPDTNQTEV